MTDKGIPGPRKPKNPGKIGNTSGGHRANKNTSIRRGGQPSLGGRGKPSMGKGGKPPKKGGGCASVVILFAALSVGLGYVMAQGWWTA